jgi:hypothetical protein
MENLIKELYLLKVPFAVIESEEITDTCFSILYRDRSIKTRTITQEEKRYFDQIKKHAKKIEYGYEGVVYEYFEFRAKLEPLIRYQFIEGLNYGRK